MSNVAVSSQLLLLLFFAGIVPVCILHSTRTLYTTLVQQFGINFFLQLVESFHFMPELAASKKRLQAPKFFTF